MRLSLPLIFALLISMDVFSQCGPDSTLISMFITNDAWAEENYWELVPTGNGCGNGTLYFGANDLVGCAGTAPVIEGGYPDNATFAVAPFCLPTGQQFDLIFVDSYGDGGAIFEVYENGSFAYTFVGVGTGNTWTFEPGNSGLPAYDSPCGALEIIPNGAGVLIDNTSCIVQTSEPHPANTGCGLYGGWCEGNITNTGWAYFVAQAGVTYEITSCNSVPGFDTQLALYRANDCLGWSSFELVVSNDDSQYGCSTSNGYSSLMFANCLDAGAVYYIQVDGWEGATGEVEITVQSVNVTNELTAIFSDIQCPIAKGEIPQSSIYPFLTGGSADFTCSWTGPNGYSSIEHNISNIGPGDYALTATDGCGNNYTAAFTVHQPDLWIVSTLATGPECEATSDGMIDLTVNGATAPYTYDWIGPNNFASTSENIANLPAGNYQVTITDDNGCTNSAYVILEPANSFSFDLGGDTVLCLDDQLMVTGPGGLLYQWQDMSDNQFYQIVASEWGVGANLIVLTASTTQGCTYSDAFNFTVMDCNGVENGIDAPEVLVYPNPTNGIIHIQLSGVEQEAQFNLIDAEGRVVATVKKNQIDRFSWNPSVASGLYTLRISTPTNQFAQRIVVR
jgi:hypothetical protein